MAQVAAGDCEPSLARRLVQRQVDQPLVPATHRCGSCREECAARLANMRQETVDDRAATGKSVVHQAVDRVAML